MLPFVDFIPDVIHCNDWQTGPVPMILRETYKKIAYLKNIKTLYTIHNLQYQGNFDPSSLEMFEVPGYLYDNGTVEFYGRMSYMKAGIEFSDVVSTVSETYANEIQTPEYGYGFDGIMRSVGGKLRGIINGIDYEENDPASDKRIFVNFDADSIEKKKENKKMLQKSLGLEERDVPLLCMITRLANQKGMDILAEHLFSSDLWRGTFSLSYSERAKGNTRICSDTMRIAGEAESVHVFFLTTSSPRGYTLRETCSLCRQGSSPADLDRCSALDTEPCPS